MGQALIVVGIVFETLGVAMAGAGLWKTWRQHAQGEPFAGPVVVWASTIASQLHSRLQRLLRRPRHVIALAGTAEGVAVVDRARLRVTWGPLPMTTKGAIAELDRRARRTWDELETAREQIADDLDEIRRAGATLTERVKSDIGRLEDATERVAIEGVRLEASGLFLVAVGLFVQGLGMAFA